jgi:hypothetical protein
MVVEKANPTPASNLAGIQATPLAQTAPTSQPSPQAGSKPTAVAKPKQPDVAGQVTGSVAQQVGAGVVGKLFGL